MNPDNMGSRFFFKLKAYDFQLPAQTGGFFFQLQAYGLQLSEAPGRSPGNGHFSTKARSMT